jgi:hypothetical protein
VHQTNGRKYILVTLNMKCLNRLNSSSSVSLCSSIFVNVHFKRYVYQAFDAFLISVKDFSASESVIS